MRTLPFAVTSGGGHVSRAPTITRWERPVEVTRTAMDRCPVRSGVRARSASNSGACSPTIKLGGGRMDSIRQSPITFATALRNWVMKASPRTRLATRRTRTRRGIASSPTSTPAERSARRMSPRRTTRTPPGFGAGATTMWACSVPENAGMTSASVTSLAAHVRGGTSTRPHSTSHVAETKRRAVQRFLGFVRRAMAETSCTNRANCTTPKTLWNAPEPHPPGQSLVGRPAKI